MARKRMIDPGIWTSEDFARLSILSRLIWVGLISNADDDGRGKANISFLKSQLFPYDFDLTLNKISKSLAEIQKNMSICFYEVDGKQYYQLTSWKKFQNINRPTPSIIPTFQQNNSGIIPEQFTEYSVNTHEQLTENSRLKEKNINIKENKERNIKKEKNTILSDSELLSLIEEEFSDKDVCQKFKEYALMRKGMGKNKEIRTTATFISCVKKLRNLARTKKEALDILDYSISNCYQGLFAKKTLSQEAEVIPYAN